MAFPLIPIAAAIAGEFLPGMVRRLAGDGAGEVAEQIVHAATKATGVSGGDAALSALRENPQAIIDLQRQMMAYEHALLEEETRRLQAVNETMRLEMTSGDGYVRRWRPTWGYITAAAWLIQSGAVGGAVTGAVLAALNGDSGAATALLRGAGDLLGALTMQWGIALMVLGVNVASRSRDKQVAAGQMPAGILGWITDNVRLPRQSGMRR